ncbi:alcohol dehydrogenase [Syntrophus gentianae]|uniref:Alcohol dehydrogenase n=2 Tax=Syntrophus gentianae TaxID=43775 RepID=A0A1H7UIU2_9BACT|nr:alcohol dehydrogenase [Syntrophus gentianae]
MADFMKAMVCRGPNAYGLEDVPAPKILEPGDVIGRVLLASISGADLAIVRGGIPEIRYPLIPGHEFCVEIVETGPAVKKLKVGDRVVVSCVACCGECWYCRQGLSARCQKAGYGAFGMRGPEGCQAEFVRIPGADVYCFKFPESLTPKDVLFCGDVLSAGYFAAEMAEIQCGETVVVVGAGPVGLCAMTTARLWSPSRIIAVDTSPFRLEAALKAGVADLALDPAKDNVLEAIRELTGGFGADRTIECAGRQITFDIAFSAVRGGGKISTVGIYEKPLSLPLNTAWGTNISLSWGFAPIDRLPGLIRLIEEGRINAAFLCTHQVPLNDILRGYEIFGSRKENCLKMLITPWER